MLVVGACYIKKDIREILTNRVPLEPKFEEEREQAMKMSEGNFVQAVE